MSDMPTPGFLQLQLRLKGVWQKRWLGQHFLFDEALLGRIADAAGLDATMLAVEVGPGAGTLTAALAARAGGVLAVEFDPRLRPVHEDVFGAFPSIRFVYDDALRVDLASLGRAAAERLGLAGGLALTGNLPFQVTSPLLFAQCGPGVPWRRMAMMVQREVADRIVSPPGCKAYGILTVKLACWWRVAQRFEVPAMAFTPRPKVDAAVLVLEPLSPDRTPSPELWPGLSAFIDAAFGQRRKMLFNSLAGRWPALPGKQACREALARQGLIEAARAEDLSPNQFRRLYEDLTRQKIADPPK
jgi:16S rRNA (adenine1518-N6/adenine1519-N6)-dimethyltransferase